MKKSLVTWFCFMVCMQAAWAQNTVESIRQRYLSIKESIASHSGNNRDDGADFGEYYHLEANQWLPGTGGHKEDTYLYWDEAEAETEEGVIYPPHHVKFVTKKFNFAAREYYQEYLYDADGSVAFIFAYDPMTRMEGEDVDMQYEFRFYLNKGRLIKGIVKRKSYQEKAFKEVWSGAKLNSLYAVNFDEYMRVAKQLRELFIHIEKEAYQPSIPR